MSELGEYRRLVEQPMIAGYEATIVSLRAEIERLQDALQQLVDYIKDGCPDDGRYYVMTEAQAALKDIKVVQPASPLRGREPTDEQIGSAILKFARDQGREVNLTYDKGSYEVTTPTWLAREFARVILTLASPPEQPADPLSDLVSGFAKALLAKLRLASANGRSGWERDDWEKQCQQGLLRHLEKGDPRDVAAYCAFMWHHGWITAPPEQPAAAPVTGEWKTMDVKPDRQMMADLFYRDLSFTDFRTGEETSPIMEFGRDERFGVGWWNGERFLHSGTAHDVFEDYSEKSKKNFPTHWRALSAPDKDQDSSALMPPRTET